MAELVTVVAVGTCFAPSRSWPGSDALNPEPDRSGQGGHPGAAALRSLDPLVGGRPVADVFAELAMVATGTTGDGRSHWLGPSSPAAAVAATRNRR
ncbi:hypothetical protein [Goodfellowiella coeruleoviolacea]|uniref:Uncharacterized protein n=1 Tax=Goodfellowiella coeruleoviolacea TaxID=334858 RepID=A0AAE3GMW1_9PSEU|nr:hypothetical protein [Goodfellowiella coeruleoviolacea]MCP2170478.1 hypothetical protein [Goodfellowiella coeruleoviolacea]